MSDSRKVLIPVEEREIAKAKFNANNSRREEIRVEIEDLEKQIAEIQAKIDQSKAEGRRLYNENGDVHRSNFSNLEIGKYYLVTMYSAGMGFNFHCLCTNNDVYHEGSFVILGRGVVYSSSDHCPWKAGEEIDLYYDCVDENPRVLDTKVVFKPE